MSFIYSRALVEGFLQEKYSAGVVSARWKTIPTVSAFSCSVKTTESWNRFLSGTTFEHFTALHGEVLLMWFRAGFLAKESRLQEPVKDLKTPDQDCGERWRGLLVKYDRDSFLWKTAHSLFQEVVPKSSLILPRWGMMRCGELWERITSPLPIGGTAFGLWRTPTASDGRGGAYAGTEKLKKRQQAHYTLRLVDQVKSGEKIWPTPTVHGLHNKKGASKNSGTGLSTAVKMFPTPTKMGGAGFCGKPDKGRTSKNSGMTLTGKVLRLEGIGPHAEKFPTPRASDGKRNQAQATDSTQKKVNSGQATLGESIVNQESRGNLNPYWVEWLMGWPIGYSALKPLGMARFQRWQQAFGEF